MKDNNQDNIQNQITKAKTGINLIIEVHNELVEVEEDWIEGLTEKLADGIRAIKVILSTKE